MRVRAELHHGRALLRVARAYREGRCRGDTPPRRIVPVREDVVRQDDAGIEGSDSKGRGIRERMRGGVMKER